MAQAIHKYLIPKKGHCKACGGEIPKYKGRYPDTCPHCDEDLDIVPRHKSKIPKNDVFDKIVGKGLSVKSIIKGLLGG